MGLAFDGDGTLNEEEIIKGAGKCLKLLAGVPDYKFTSWENSFLEEQIILNEMQEACSYRELIKLREIVGKYVQ